MIEKAQFIFPMSLNTAEPAISGDLGESSFGEDNLADLMAPPRGEDDRCAGDGDRARLGEPDHKVGEEGGDRGSGGEVGEGVRRRAGEASL